MKLNLGAHAARNIVKIDADGTIMTYFGATGHLKCVVRTRFEQGDRAATGSFLISDGSQHKGREGQDEQEVTAPFGLMFVSEVHGEEKIAMVERFATEGDAQLAFSQITRAMLKESARANFWRGWRTGLVWLGAPLLSVIVCMAVVRFLDSHNGAIDVLRNLLNTQGSAGMLLQRPQIAPAQLPMMPPALAPQSPVLPLGGSTPMGMNSSAIPIEPPAKVASAIPPTVSGNFLALDFGLSNQKPDKVLYVYADPNCPACRRFEPHVKDLEKDFEIRVLPVAYQKDSLWMARMILCSSDPRKTWTQVMSSLVIDQPMQGQECHMDDESIKANMQMFEKLGFNQTPRVVSGTGYVFPAGATAADIRAKAANFK